jgi:hypothetical protein
VASMAISGEYSIPRMKLTSLVKPAKSTDSWWIDDASIKSIQWIQLPCHRNGEARGTNKNWPQWSSFEVLIITVIGKMGCYSILFFVQLRCMCIS